MSTKQQYLMKYKNIEKPKAPKLKKKKKAKNSLMILDEDETGFQDEDEEEVYVEKDFSTQFKQSGAGWEVVQDGERKSSENSGIERDSRSDTKRRSPSPSPERKLHTRRSPSPSPERPRRSPSTSPERPRRRKSPSPSPERPSGRRGSPSPSPERNREAQSLSREDAQQPYVPQETVYRDKSGKIIYIAAQKAELEAEKKRKEAEQASKVVWGSGLVQKQVEEQKKHRLNVEKSSGFAVFADDEERNAQLKQKVLWGDTMASLTVKKSKRAVYNGPSEPNRFGIAPGYRWDGIDRGNGFELKLFRSKHEIQEAQAAFQTWAQEDM